MRPATRLALTVGRCAPFVLTVPLATVWHNFARTEISITDNYSIDPLPVDPVFAEFESVAA